MAVLVPLAIFMSLWCYSLFGEADSNKSEICDTRHIGLKSGDKCTFDNQNFCNWTRAGTGTQWEVKNGEAYADMTGTGQGHRAILTSPWMCEDNVMTICVQFDYKFDDRDGGRLSLWLCNFTLGCEVLWSADSNDNNIDTWHHVNRNGSLIRRGKFQMQFQGEKTKDKSFSRETNFYLDNIIYENTSCIIDSTTTSPTTTDLSTSGEKATTDTYTDLSTPAASDEDEIEKSSTANDDEESSQLIMIAALIAVLMLTAAVVVVVVYFRRQRADSDTGSKKSSINRDPRSSIAMVTNDFYDQTDGAPNNEAGILLQDLGTSPDPDNYYSVIDDTGGNEEVNTQSNPDVVVHHGCDNYEIVDLDEDNVHWKLQQPVLDISSHS